MCWCEACVRIFWSQWVNLFASLLDGSEAWFVGYRYCIDFILTNTYGTVRCTCMLIAFLVWGSFHQCSRPVQRITDPDPALFVSGFRDANKKKFVCFFLTVGLFTTVVKDNKSQNRNQKSQNSINQSFTKFFAFWWKDPGPDPEPDPYKNYGSGSWMPKNLRILFRIPNTGFTPNLIAKGFHNELNRQNILRVTFCLAKF